MKIGAEFRCASRVLTDQRLRRNGRMENRLLALAPVAEGEVGIVPGTTPFTVVVADLVGVHACFPGRLPVEAHVPFLACKRELSPLTVLLAKS